MAYTYRGTSNLIALPNRTVQTYPSGLVRVERSFVCRKADVAKNRNTIRVNERMPMDDGAPAFDGLFIFPEPQEIVRDDGFVEFRVTAYGRTRTQGDATIERGSELGEFYYFNYVVDPPLQYTQSAINETYTLKLVVASAQSIDTVIAAPEINNPVVLLAPFTTPVKPRQYTSGSTLGIDGVTIFPVTTTITINIGLASYSSTSFGNWIEYVIIYKAVGNSLTTA